MPGKQKKRQTEGENHRLSADSHYKSYTPYTAFTHTFNTLHMPQYRACHTSNMQYKLPAADRYQRRAHVSLSFLWFGCPTHSARAHTHAYTHTRTHTRTRTLPHTDSQHTSVCLQAGYKNWIKCTTLWEIKGLYKEWYLVCLGAHSETHTHFPAAFAAYTHICMCTIHPNWHKHTHTTSDLLQTLSLPTRSLSHLVIHTKQTH